MTEKLVTYGLSCTVYLLEAVVLFFLLYRRRGRRLRGVLIYLIALIALDGMGRSYVL